MIFITVGTQLPFDRLTTEVWEWAQSILLDDAVFQIGPNGRNLGNYRCYEYLKTAEFDAFFRNADLIVSHAGMGNIIKSIEHQKPLIIVPRRASLGEHRNDHQLATCEKFKDRRGIYAAEDSAQLRKLLNRYHGEGLASTKETMKDSELVAYVSRFIRESLDADVLQRKQLKP